jgi:uncharacterized iron-regulated protein
MMPLSAVAVLVAVASAAIPQDTVPRIGEFRVYSGAGDPVSLDSVVAAMVHRDVVFIGESHNDLTGHHLELELLTRAFGAYGSDSARGGARPVALSLEMFERDVQYVVDEYLRDLVTEDQFRASSRPWPEYETDYRPLVEFAKQHNLDVIAANAPRRYANRVSRLGPDALMDLSEQALATLPPLPYGSPSAAYAEQWRQAMVDAMEEMRRRCPPPPAMERAVSADSAPRAMPMASHATSSNPLQAQALWDASMAYSISQYLNRHPRTLVLHMVGSFHVEHGTGIPEHLQVYRPGTSALIVVMRPVEDIEAFDSERFGGNEDFVILTEESVTRPTPCPGES